MAVASGPVGPVLAGPIFSPHSHTHLSCCVEHMHRFKDLQLLRSPSSRYSPVEHFGLLAPIERPIMAGQSTSGSSSSDSLLPSKPHQPLDFSFPKRSFGQKPQFWEASNNLGSVSGHSCISYDETQDLVFCHTCLLGFEKNKIRASKADPAFVSLY